MAETLFTNVRIFDGNAKRPYAGEVMLQGNLIKKVAKGKGKIRANGANVVDGAGATLMPGMIEPHSHVCYTDCTSLPEIGRLQPEEHMVLALENAKKMLDQGFTSLFSAAGVGYNKLRIEPVLRDVINAGRYPGPRIKAASPEIVSPAGSATSACGTCTRNRWATSPTGRTRCARPAACACGRAWTI